MADKKYILFHVYLNADATDPKEAALAWSEQVFDPEGVEAPIVQADDQCDWDGVHSGQRVLAIALLDPETSEVWSAGRSDGLQG